MSGLVTKGFGVDAAIITQAPLEVVDVTQNLQLLDAEGGVPVEAITITKGEYIRKRFKVLEDGAVKDISQYTFKFGVKKSLSDSTFKIGPLDGVLETDGTDGIFYIDLLPTAAITNQTPFSGVFAVAAYDSLGRKDTLTSPGGDPFTIEEDILDVA